MNEENDLDILLKCPNCNQCLKEEHICGICGKTCCENCIKIHFKENNKHIYDLDKSVTIIDTNELDF